MAKQNGLIKCRSAEIGFFRQAEKEIYIQLMLPGPVSLAEEAGLLTGPDESEVRGLLAWKRNDMMSLR